MESLNEERNRLASSSISPAEPVAAGSYGCWRLVYRVGPSGIAVGGGIKVGSDSDSDWGEPQFQRPGSPDYVSVSTTGKATLSTVIEGGYLRRYLKIHVHQRPLVEGDEICVVYGDRSHGSPGSRAQTFAEEKRYFRIYLDSSGEGRYSPIPDPPHLRVVGGEVKSLKVTAPSQLAAGEPFKASLKALDSYGNPAHDYVGTVLIEGGIISLPSRHEFEPNEHGVTVLRGLITEETGVHRIRVRDAHNSLHAVSNPILCYTGAMEDTLYWGDLHGQVKLAEKIAEYFRFARDVSFLDFASHQRNDHEVSNEDWEVTKRTVREFNQPGFFVVFLGYEWSGDTSLGGDHNIYYLEDDQPIRRSGHEMVEDKSDVDTDLHHILDVYREFEGGRVLIVPHVGGRPADLRFHDEELEPVIEVHSTHGTFEWFLREALERGYRVGFIAGSDDYKLRLGGAYPGIGDRRFVKGGLTAIYAPDLTRESLFKSLKDRRCYGTTGERIILRVECDGHMMGEEYTTNIPPRITIHVWGTSHLERVELYRGLDRIFEFCPKKSSKVDSRLIKIAWGGASHRGPYSGVLWEGKLKIEKGRLSHLNPMPLDRGDESFNEFRGKSFSWRTYTSGDWDGAHFQVEGEEAELVVEATSKLTASVNVGTGRRICASLSQVDRIAFQLPIKELDLEAMVIKVGPLDRQVMIQRLDHLEDVTDVKFEFIDTSFVHGINPYWIRVTQRNGEMAWSSPIYVKGVEGQV